MTKSKARDAQLKARITRNKAKRDRELYTNLH